MSGPTLKVLKVFLEQPRVGLAGADLTRKAKVGSGTLYPMLSRLEQAGWVSGEWENIDPQAAGRPRRRFYTLTGLGQRNALNQFADFRVEVGVLAWNS
jgi:DNA-binding PadR family transcriptional regulator